MSAFEKIDAIVQSFGGNADFVECKVAPHWGALTREVLAINMAGCKPEYAPIRLPSVRGHQREM
jgi:hypothetical protein